MDEDRQLLGVRGSSKRPASSSFLRFIVVVLVLLLIVAASAIVGMMTLPCVSLLSHHIKHWSVHDFYS